MSSIGRPLVASGLLFALARGYSMSQGVDVPLTTQLLVAGVLGGSVYVSGFTEQENPATRALVAGSLFAGSMYALGNDRVLTHAVLGTLTTYVSDIVLEPPKENAGQEQE